MPLVKVACWALAALLTLAVSVDTAVNAAPFQQAPARVVSASETEQAPVTTARTASTAQMPSAIRSGLAQMAIQRVESDVSRDEIASAIQAIVAQQRVCMSWPALWIESSDNRRVVVVRFDLMARDWGEDVAAAAEARMQEFVALGLFTQRARPDLGPGALEFTLTPEGRSYMSGALVSGARPSFCGPAERRVVEIVSTEWGDFPCGTLHVRFTHVADAWPSWVRTDAARERIAAVVPPLGEVAYGEVSLSRLWRSRQDLGPGEVNGSLNSVCYNADRDAIVGADLNMAAAPPPPLE